MYPHSQIYEVIILIGNPVGVHALWMPVILHGNNAINKNSRPMIWPRVRKTFLTCAFSRQEKNRKH